VSVRFVLATRLCVGGRFVTKKPGGHPSDILRRRTMIDLWAHYQLRPTTAPHRSDPPHGHIVYIFVKNYFKQQLFLAYAF